MAGHTMTGKQIDKAYDMIDTNKNGSIDKAEMILYIKNLMAFHGNLQFGQSAEDYMQDKIKKRVADLTMTLTHKEKGKHKKSKRAHSAKSNDKHSQKGSK